MNGVWSDQPLVSVPASSCSRQERVDKLYMCILFEMYVSLEAMFLNNCRVWFYINQSYNFLLLLLLLL